MIGRKFGKLPTFPFFYPKNVNIVRAKFSKMRSRKRSGDACGRNGHNAASARRAHLCGHFDTSMSTSGLLYRKLHLLKVEAVMPPWKNPLIKG